MENYEYEDDELDLLKLVSTNADDTSQYLLFDSSENELFALNVSKIRELLVYKELEISKNPDKNSLIIGSAYIRGELVPLVKFDAWYGNKILDDNEYELVIVTNFGGHSLGIIVKSVEYITTIESEEMQDNSQNNIKTTFIADIKMNSKHILVNIFDADLMLLDLFSNIDKDVNKVKNKVNIQKVILFADDSMFIRKMVSELAEKMNLKYQVLNDGKQLLEAMKQYNPNEIGLIVTDLEMPVMDGKEFIKNKNKLDEYKNIPVIVHTNMANDIMVESLKKIGVTKVIGKIDMLKLSEAIKEVLGE